MTASLAQGLSPVRAELANGAVVLVQETVMTPAVTISASFRAGSMFDPVDLPGLAYLTGRVIDRGTERRTASMIADELDERGVSLRVSSQPAGAHRLVHLPGRGFRRRAGDCGGRGAQPHVSAERRSRSGGPRR